MKMDRDLYYLHKALLLAKKGIYSVNPNPAVGAIVVKNEKIIGMGYHKSPGSAHAEQIALKKAGYNSAGATLYVNLEPCCTGRDSVAITLIFFPLSFVARITPNAVP